MLDRQLRTSPPHPRVWDFGAAEYQGAGEDDGYEGDYCYWGEEESVVVAARRGEGEEGEGEKVGGRGFVGGRRRIVGSFEPLRGRDLRRGFFFWIERKKRTGKAREGKESYEGERECLLS